MMSAFRYEIHPAAAWVQEDHGQIALLPAGDHRVIHLDGLEAILWLTLWQGYSPDLWQELAEENGLVIAHVLADWEKAGYLRRETA